MVFQTHSPVGYQSNFSHAAIEPSGSASSVPDTSAILAGIPLARPCLVKLMPGIWTVQAGQVVIPNSGVYIDATGCLINVVGNGDLFRMYDASSYSPRVLAGCGLTGFPVIDGSLTNGPSSAFHAGDAVQVKCEANVRKFMVPGSKGVWFDNQHFWTEQIQGRIRAVACAAGIVFDESANVSGQATGSYERMHLKCYLENDGVGDGVVFQNGAFTENAKLEIKGNFNTSTVAQYAVLRLTGSDLSGQFSTILHGGLDIGVELGDTTNILPQTIAFGAGGNLIWDTHGVIDFSANKTFANSNNSGQFRHYGPVYGDTKLFGSEPSTPALVQALTGSAQTIFTAYATLTRVTPTGSFTGEILAAGQYSNQRVTVVNASAFTVTFAASATSHVADGVADVIAANTAATYVWDTGTSLWYRTV